MNREEAIQEARNFHCPRYHELPDIGLYLEQVMERCDFRAHTNQSAGE